MKNYSQYFFSIPLITYFLYRNRYYIIGKKFRKFLISRQLKERFRDKFQIEYNKKFHTIGIIRPSNVYDMQKLFSISNHYKVPIISDISQPLIPYPHLLLNLDLFNDFTFHNKRITVNSGIKIKRLLEIIKLKGCSIKPLEEYGKTDMNLSDILFNHYYGSELLEYIEEFSILTPKGEKIFTFKPFSDFSLNHFNSSYLFLLSSNLIGVLLDVKLKLDSFSTYNYYQLNKGDKIEQSKDYDVIYIFDNDLKKGEFFAKVSSDKDKTFKNDIYNHSVKATRITEAEYQKKVNKIEMPLRKIKVFLNENDFKLFFEKYKNKLGTFTGQIKEIIPHTVVTKSKNKIEIAFPTTDNVELIEKEYFLLREIYKITSKLNGKFFTNKNISVATKYDLMREIGYNNYFFNENIKYEFDPDYILNPHLCNRRPNYLNFIKRNNRILNYIFTKIKL